MESITSRSPVSRPKTAGAWIRALASCLTVTHRPDGSKYTHLSDAPYWATIKDDLQDIIQEAHLGELPNNWAYETIDSIAGQLLDYIDSEFEDDLYDQLHDIADVTVDHSNSHLFQWLADIPSRAYFGDDSMACEPPCELPKLAQLRQYEHIYSMANAILNKAYSLADS